MEVGALAGIRCEERLAPGWMPAAGHRVDRPASITTQKVEITS
ncbi:hypothetical protein [Bifidobacterium psychraerophilum]|jgi:hypothetical protein